MLVGDAADFWRNTRPYSPGCEAVPLQRRASSIYPSRRIPAVGMRGTRFERARAVRLGRSHLPRLPVSPPPHPNCRDVVCQSLLDWWRKAYQRSSLEGRAVHNWPVPTRQFLPLCRHNGTSVRRSAGQICGEKGRLEREKRMRIHSPWIRLGKSAYRDTAWGGPNEREPRAGAEKRQGVGAL